VRRAEGLLRLASVPVAFWVVSLLALRVVVVPPESCGDVEPAAARDSALRAGAWLVRNQLPDGQYLYEWLEETDQPTTAYNIVRHAGVTMSLYQLAGQTGDKTAFAGAERATAWMLVRLIAHDDWVALAEPDQAPLGASALMLVSLAERRLLTGDTHYDEVMQGLGRFMLAMQRDDGGFSTRWYTGTQERDPVDTSPYFPGEAAWALALLHEALPDTAFETATRRAVDFITTRRDEVEEVEFPPLNDHWASYAMAEMAEWQPPLSDQNIDYARRLAGRFSLFIRYESQKEEDLFGEVIRGKPERAAALGTWVEGSSALWRLAVSDARMADLAGEIRERSACGAGVLMARQAGEERIPQEAGAWFNRGITRMDDQQHAISGLLYTADALEDDPVREPQPWVASGAAGR
jgi:hypothetical protein